MGYYSQVTSANGSIALKFISIWPVCNRAAWMGRGGSGGSSSRAREEGKTDAANISAQSLNGMFMEHLRDGAQNDLSDGAQKGLT